MNELEGWQQGNDAYLAAALAWLRLRLERLAGPVPADPVKSAQTVAPERRGVFGRRAATPPIALPPSSGTSEDEVRKAQEAMQAAEKALEPPPALRLIGERLGLSGFEREVLLLCAALELDTRTAELCRAAHGHPYPTFALALSLFENPAWDVLSPERPLRYWRLLDINQPAAQPLTTSALRADERIVNALKGLNYLDDRIGPLLTPLEASPLELPPSQQVVVDLAVGHLRRNHAHPWPVIQLVGHDSESLRLVARHSAHALDLPLYELPAENIPTQSAELETLARLWQRESLLAPVALYLDASGLEQSAAAHTALLRFLARTDGIIFLASREAWTTLNRVSHPLDVAKPTPNEQRDLWHSLLKGAADPVQLSAQFDLSTETIHQVVREALEATDHRSLQERLWDGCRDASRPRLAGLAQRLDSRATWDRLVLPEAELRLLHEITEQVRHRAIVYDDWGFGKTMNRGLGISVLFAGESGTGKTMAAEVIANDLKLDLYRIDLSSVVNKYIGETEKNLRKLFDAAENGGAILFFDEADALFGKRSEVKDAHDRYANIEINYLLQRMEAYRGLAILATNMKSALDPAFVRRLRFIVDFPFPNAVNRERMWKTVFPAGARVEELDYNRLAKLNLTGASIHNAALNAAFLAATRDAHITMRDVLDAARNEFKKLERPVREADFHITPKKEVAM